MLCAERVWRAPVAKHEENVALAFRNFGLEKEKEKENEKKKSSSHRKLVVLTKSTITDRK